MNENPPKSTPENEPKFSPPPRKSLTAWTLLLPLLLLAGVVWQGMREPESTNDIPPVAPTKKPADKPVTYILFVPGDDGKLHKVVVHDPVKRITHAVLSDSSQRTRLRSEAATHALDMLFQKASDAFPAGTRLVKPVNLGGGMARVSLNKAFAANSDSWSSTESLMRVYSIVNTVVATKNQISGSDDDAVQLQVEDNVVSTLGELDVSDHIEPDMTLVANN